MGILLSSFRMPAGALNDGDALFGLDVVWNLIVLVFVSVSGSLVNVSSAYTQEKRKLLGLIKHSNTKLNIQILCFQKG